MSRPLPIATAIGETAGRLGRQPTAAQAAEIEAGLRRFLVVDIAAGHAAVQLPGGDTITATDYLARELSQPWIERRSRRRAAT